MTEEYKENTLKYLVGNISNTSEVRQDGDEVRHIKTINETIDNYLREEGQEHQGHIDYNILYYQNYTIAYGAYTQPISGNPRTGYILILDQNFDKVAYLDKFTTGTDLYPIVAMNYDENGNFYAVTDNVNELSDTGSKRLILLNNIIASGYKYGNYRVILRTSYFLKNQDVILYGGNKGIYKIQGEATYYILSVKNSSPKNTLITRVKINVGAENEWQDFDTGLLHTGGFDCYAKKNNGTYDMIYGIFNLVNSSTINYEEVTVSGDTLSKTSTQLPNIKTSQVSIDQVFIINENQKYCVARSDDQKINYLFYITGSNVKILKEFTYTNENPAYLSLYLLNNLPLLYYVEENNYSQIAFMKNFHDQFSYYWSEKIYNSEVSFDRIVGTFNFELYSVYMGNSDQYGYDNYKTEMFQFIYDGEHLVGKPQESIASLVPTKMILKVSPDDKMILFARELYNNVLQMNTITSTVQIPNTYLNDQQIGCEILNSYTYNNLNEETTVFEKNIYETVNLNIANTWNIINENDKQNPIYNTDGASKFLDATGAGTKLWSPVLYDMAQISKYRLNYEDGTFEDYPSPKPKKLSNLRYRYTLYLYAHQKNIVSIQLINGDASIIYQTIQVNLKSGTSYIVSQRVRIDEGQSGNLVYKKQKILYNGNQIIY